MAGNSPQAPPPNLAPMVQFKSCKLLHSNQRYQVWSQWTALTFHSPASRSQGRAWRPTHSQWWANRWYSSIFCIHQHLLRISCSSKKLKKISEVKSFSSFSFNDIALDKRLDEFPSETLKISHRYSDPCLLESGAGINLSGAGIKLSGAGQFSTEKEHSIEKLNRENDAVKRCYENDLLMHDDGASLYQAYAPAHSSCVDYWLENQFEGENVEWDDEEETMKTIKHANKKPLKGNPKMEEMKKEKQMGKNNLFPSIIQTFILGTKKQVSIFESMEQSDDGQARKKREKFKRQDTPLHPDSISCGQVKRLNTPKSLSIGGNSNLSYPSTHVRTISCDERLKSPTLCPLGQATKHKKTQNLTCSQNPIRSPQISVNSTKLDNTPRYAVHVIIFCVS